MSAGAVFPGLVGFVPRTGSSWADDVLVVILACLLTLLAGLPAAYADDTEVYIGLSADQDNVNPNVLFIIDTSGSMNTDVEVTTDFDPATDYEITYWRDVNDECADDDRVFYSQNASSPPDCDSSNNFDRSKLVCLGALESLYGAGGATVTGRYTDQFGAWQDRNRGRDRWTDSRFDRSNRVLVECEDDKGIHGETASGPAWPTDDNGPYVASDPDDRRPPWQDWSTYTFYSANYLRWYHYHSVTTSMTRLEIVQDVAKDLVDSVSEIDIGLMRFDTRAPDPSGTFPATHGWWGDRQGGLVVYPMRDIDAEGVRADFKSAVNSLNASGYTPLAETLYEAMLYYRGGTVRYGVGDNGQWSHSGSRSGSSYISPITYECSKNYVVFLTDGLPNTDNDADSQINALLSNTSGLTLGGCNNGTGNPIDNCLNELAEYMYKTDSATAALGNELVGTQNITTYMVGFNVDDDGIMESAATKGGGRYYNASTAQQLSNAFTQIIEDILRVNTTFTSPAVSVNAFNRLTHRNELYFTVFQPNDRPHWPGNVKKFRIGVVRDGQGQPVDGNNDGEADIAIFDANGDLAVDQATGFFKETSRSYWTPDDFAPDGDQAGEGGLASRLFDYSDDTNQHDAASRANRVFTYTNSSDVDGPIVRLADAANAIHENNAYIAGANEAGRITREMLGEPGITDAQLIDFLKWARGVDVNDEDDDGATDDGRPSVGAPLHTKPLLVTYFVDTANNVQTDYLFVVTNSGYLHMVPTADPAGVATPAGGARLENWTFMPPDKLRNVRTLYEDDEASNITYGIDGGIDLWLNDVNGDFDLLDADGDVDSGEHAYLYFGQRRGGNSYYALDVSEPANPKYLWSVTAEGATASSPYSRLGQTWSRPRHTTVFFQEGNAQELSKRHVIVVGGGYDTGQDSGGARTPDDVGNAIFILDAVSGEVLWWAGGTPAQGGPVPDRILPQMAYSIPADIRVIDVNGDGVMDRFFAADMGGQLWRFDIANDSADSLANRITGGRIADLQKVSSQASDPGEADNRRFYYSPDVALVVPEAGAPFHSIAIGSGYRAHPNDTAIGDRIYLLKDYDIKTAPRDDDGDVSYTTRYPGDLLDVTDVLDLGNLSDSDAAKLLNGWYVDLEASGEKALATALTVDNAVLITTFIPASQDAANLNDVCSPSQGGSRLYALDAATGRPVANLDRLGGETPADLTLTDRYYELTRRGIAPEVTIIFPEEADVSPTPIVGTELVPELKIDDAPEATYWYQQRVH